MTVIAKACPGSIRQTENDSCWAAVLEAWGRADPLGPQVRQANLITRWSDQLRGGISGAEMERLARSLSLQGVFLGMRGRMVRSPIPTIRAQLPTSYVSCMYTVGTYSHTVLIYRVRDSDVSVMDPNGGRYLNLSHSWLVSHAPYGLLWK
jgi:hypothetical protein